LIDLLTASLTNALLGTSWRLDSISARRSLPKAMFAVPLDTWSFFAIVSKEAIVVYMANDIDGAGYLCTTRKMKKIGRVSK